MYKVGYLFATVAALSITHAAAAQEPAPQSGSAPSVMGQRIMSQGAPSDGASAPVAGASPATAAVPTPVPSSDTLGDNFFSRFFNYQKLEWGKSGAPADPSAPPSRREGWSPQPENAPPMPFTEWPYGGATSLGVNRAASVDSPLMVAIGSNNGLGKLLSDAHIQAYGWIDVGGNVSTSHGKGGNAPAAYDYNPNTVQLDQAVLYVERAPDTVQKDHIDWGFRVSGIYGENYRYTTSFGLWSYQLLKHNHNYGYDAPMLYVEAYVPQIADGLLLRFGRFISLPDIEAQLAPNNYMYTHSLTYTYDNYTNTGLQGTLALNKNIFIQLGITAGSDTTILNVGKKLPNPYPNPLYPGTTFLKDPGAKASYTGCLRLQSNSANDNIYLCADAINNGVWGYNNLQWFGVTYYHKFNDAWHLAFESYNLHQKDLPNLNNPIAAAALANGGTPFSTPAFKFNAPGGAYCKDAATLKCTASAQSALTYLNYQFSPLDNLSIRAEYYNDMQGQRTGTATQYLEFGVGLQHWFSPQIEVRPELTYYNSLDRPAFDGNSNYGRPADKSYELVASGDVIVHF